MTCRLVRLRLRLAVVGAVVCVAGCSGAAPESTPSSSPPATPTASATATPSPTPAHAWPLTGEPAPGATATPVLVVKVDNTRAAQPQQGLQAADLVVEEPVEGGLTRLAVMLQSRVPAAGPLVVGPVRSVRTSDVGIVGPTGGVLVASGGAPAATSALQAAGVRTVLEGGPGFYREPSRRAPYNLMVDLPALAAAYPPEPLAGSYLVRGAPSTLPAGAPASTLTLRFSGAATTTLRAVGAGWARDGVPDGFVASSVVALLLPVTAAGYLDPAGNPVPEVLTTGSGDGVLAHAGQVWAVRWSKASPVAPWTLTLADGTAAGVPPGTVYLALLGQGSGSIASDAPAG